MTLKTKLTNLFQKLFDKFFNSKKENISYCAFPSNQQPLVVTPIRGSWDVFAVPFDGWLYVNARKCNGIDLSCGGALSTLTGTYFDEFGKSVLEVSKGEMASYLIHNNTDENAATAECYVTLVRTNGSIYR